jgi:hypothetical protein
VEACTQATVFFNGRVGRSRERGSSPRAIDFQV